MTLLAQAQAVKAELNRITQQIEEFSRTIDGIRHPNSNLTRNHKLTSWYKSEVGPSTDWYQDEILFETGTPIVNLSFYHKRWEDEIMVIIPLEYFDDPEGAPEKERIALAARQALAAERQKVIEEERKIAEAIARRETYERLRAEFGDQPPVTKDG